MPYYKIGRYAYYTNPPYCILVPSQDWSDPNNSVQDFDHSMRKSLNELFCERCGSSSGQIKRFLRGLQRNTKEDFIVKQQILEQEPLLSRLFSKEEFGKLSLLWIAVLAGYKESAELLVRSGADVNELFGSHKPQVIDEKWTVLHLLLRMNPSPENERLIRLVVMDHGADLQARDSEGRTALHFAAMKGLVQMAEKLIEKGADLQARDYLRRTALHYAATEGLVPMAEMLFEKGTDLQARDSEGRTALHTATTKGLVQMAEKLLEKGADLQAQDCLRRTAMHYAATDGLVQMAKMLLEKGANLKARDNKEQTVLHYAVISGQLQVTEMLLEKGADMEARDFKNRTALRHAVSKDQLQITKMLLEKGAEVNVVSGYDSETPLLVAARSSKADELIPLLMKHGADITAKDKNGRNVLHCLRLLDDLKRTADLVRTIIEKDVSLIEEKDGSDRQPIHAAASKGNNDLVNLYLDYGANVNALACKTTPLHLVAESYTRNPTVLNTLLKRGANPNLRTSGDGTALHAVCEKFDNLNTLDEKLEEQMIRLLLSAGADVLIEDHKGRTPLARIQQHNMAKSATRLIVKKLAWIKTCKPTLELKDEKIIKRSAEYRNYYQDCIAQIERAKSTRFIESCTFYELLTICQCRIAALMQNPVFGTNFRNYDLTEFAAYAEDLIQAFERAEKFYESMLDQEDLINEAVHYILPYVIVRKVVNFICKCNCFENVK